MNKGILDLMDAPSPRDPIPALKHDASLSPADNSAYVPADPVRLWELILFVAIISVSANAGTIAWAAGPGTDPLTGLSDYSWMLAAPLATVATAPFAAYVADWVGRRTAMIYLGLASATGLLWAGLSDGTGLFLAFILMGLGGAAATMVAQTSLTDRTDWQRAPLALALLLLATVVMELLANFANVALGNWARSGDAIGSMRRIVVVGGAFVLLLASVLGVVATLRSPPSGQKQGPRQQGKPGANVKILLRTLRRDGGFYLALLAGLTLLGVFAIISVRFANSSATTLHQGTVGILTALLVSIGALIAAPFAIRRASAGNEDATIVIAGRVLWAAPVLLIMQGIVSTDPLVWMLTLYMTYGLFGTAAFIASTSVFIVAPPRLRTQIAVLCLGVPLVIGEIAAEAFGPASATIGQAGSLSTLTIETNWMPIFLWGLVTCAGACFALRIAARRFPRFRTREIAETFS